MLIERREMGAAEGAPGSDSEMKANLARVLLSDLVVIEVGRRSLGGHCCWTEIGEKKFAVKDIHRQHCISSCFGPHDAACELCGVADLDV